MPLSVLPTGAAAPAVRTAIIHQPGGILALDLSGTVGWAYGAIADRIPMTGSWLLPHTGGEGARYGSLSNELALAIQAWAPAHLILEKALPFMAQTAQRSAEQQYGLRAIAHCEAWRASCPISEIDVHTARGEVMGQRRISRDTAKREVVLYCRRRAIPVQSHHAADAAIVWLWLRDRLTDRAPVAGPLFREVA